MDVAWLHRAFFYGLGMLEVCHLIYTLETLNPKPCTETLNLKHPYRA